MSSARSSFWLSNSHQSRKPTTSCLTSRPTTREPSYCYCHAKFGPRAKIVKHLVHGIRLSAANQTFVRHKVGILSIRFLMTMHPSSLTCFFIRDPFNGLGFVIDTGSSRSLLPRNLRFDQSKAIEKMFVDNGSEAMLFETVHLIISLGVGRHLPWQFTKANVRFPAIRIDFFRHYGLIIDTVKLCLRNATTTGNEGKKPSSDVMVFLLSKTLI